ncbi:AraC family transcriptional regulator (plasmid) [Kovacikia minuta CCNUW1]|uniref:helix-turn-helix domain-containing protein n=1 Tax=Kovacikia minuta TaxID=2931930 RepID=UPI001CCC4B24|nr:AraC family transcriptional regulator [Kovacikia minuta]UBF30469.1 AraC family transcriptional regulator [Kovacikia minuta CCNUW1]
MSTAPSMLDTTVRNLNTVNSVASGQQFEWQHQPESIQSCVVQINEEPNNPFDRADHITYNIQVLEQDSYRIHIKLHQNADQNGSSQSSIVSKNHNPIAPSPESDRGKPSDGAVIEKLLSAIATYLKQQPITPPEEPIASQVVAAPNNLSDPLLNRVFDFIEANYHRSISLSDVAQAVGYSPAYLTDVVRRQTGQPVHSWIIERRMAAARSLLLETDQPITRIAETIGYQDAGHFFRQFRQRHGIPPQAWRNTHAVHP